MAQNRVDVASRPSRVDLPALRIVSILTIGGLTALGLMLVGRFDQEARAAVLDRYDASVSVSARSIDELYDSGSRDLRLASQNYAFELGALATGAEIDRIERRRIDEALSYLGTRYQVDEICLIAADGREIARWDIVGHTAQAADLSPDESVNNPTFGQAMVLADDLVARSEPYVSPDSARWVFGLGTPISLADGQRAGVLHFEIPIARLREVVDAAGGQPLGPRALIYDSVDLFGRVPNTPIGDPANGDPIDPPPAWFDQANHVASAAGRSIVIDGVGHWVATRPVLDGSATLAIAVPETRLFATVDDARAALVLAVMLAALTLAALGYASVRHVERQARRLDESRRTAESRYRDLIESVPTVVYQSEPGAHRAWTYVSPRIESLLGVGADEWISDPQLRARHIHPEDREWVLRDEVESFLPGRRQHAIEYRMLSRSGDARWIRDEAAVISGPDGQPLYWSGFLTDVTDRHLLEEQLRHQAFHDPLTGLPNRSLFMDRLEHALRRLRRRQGFVAVLFIDLDNFKTVNDSLGHGAGDRLLVAATERLLTTLRSEDTAARFGGDEFAILIEDSADPAESVAAAERVRAAFEHPFLIDGVEAFVTASIGVAFGRGRRVTAEDLVRRADVAMYAAKAHGKGRTEQYDPAMSDASRGRMELRTDLGRALEHGEFRLLYQPIMNLSTDSVAGFEALIRWDHPTRGLLSPSEFIPLAEETGLIVPIGRWVISEACAQASRWKREHSSHSAWAMTVNVAGRQLQDEQLVEAVHAALGKAGFPPRDLILEITETTALEPGPGTLDRLTQLRALGVRIAIDDFGTGYSSLSSLRGLPVDCLKIDKTFIDDIANDPRARAIAGTIIRMGRSLGLDTVAEGIESSDQEAVLRQIGCEYGQGYLFARPLDSDAARATLAEQSGAGRTARASSA